MKVLSEGLSMRRDTCTNTAWDKRLLVNLLISVYFSVRRA